VRDGGSRLSELVQALAAQTVGRDRFEVVVADDGSTDGATDSLEPGDGWLRVSRDRPRNSYAARNRGVRASRAPALAFCDADCLPEPDWLEAGLRALERTEIVAGLVRFDVPARRSVWSLVDVDLHLDQERSVAVGRAATANLFVRRDVFERVGGFDESLPNTADFDFVHRAVEAGARLVFEPAAVVRHPTRDRAGAVLRKVWAVNRRYAARETRERRRPAGLKAREWVPLVQPLRARRRHGRSLRLDRRRLAASGVAPTLWEDAAALPLLYLVVPYLRGLAQLHGWWEARSARRVV
jgi:GT2 family glycosyltransferase